MCTSEAPHPSLVPYAALSPLGPVPLMPPKLKLSIDLPRPVSCAHWAVKTATVERLGGAPMTLVHALSMTCAASVPESGVRSGATRVAVSVRVRPSIASNPGAAAGADPLTAGMRLVRSGSAAMVVIGSWIRRSGRRSLWATAKSGPFSRTRLLRGQLGAQDRQVFQQLHDLG